VPAQVLVLGDGADEGGVLVEDLKGSSKTQVKDRATIAQFFKQKSS
jgi:hypothetical protein